MQKLTKLKGESRQIHIYCRKLQIPLLMADRESRQKIYKTVEELNIQLGLK